MLTCSKCGRDDSSYDDIVRFEIPASGTVEETIGLGRIGQHDVVLCLNCQCKLVGWLREPRPLKWNREEKRFDPPTDKTS